jgi:hypothetical protein
MKKALAFIMDNPDLLASLSKDQLTILLGLVREEKERLRGWAHQASLAVPDSLVRDHRRRWPKKQRAWDIAARTDRAKVHKVS